MIKDCLTNHLKKALLGVFFIFSSHSIAFEQQDFDKMLNHAEQLRSADGKAFLDMLEKVSPHFDELSIDQKYFFIYLTGYKHSYEGKIDEGIKSYEHVFQNTQNKDLKHRAAISLMNVFALNRDWLSGFKYLDYINKINVLIDEVGLRHDGWITSAIFYNELELYELSLFNVKRLIDEGVEGRNLCFTKAIEVKALVSQKESGMDSGFFQEAINHCRSVKESVVADVITYYFSQYLIERTEFKKAYELLASNLEQVEASEYKISILGTYSVLARSALELGDLKNAIKYAEKATQNDLDVSVVYPVIEAKQVLYRIALEQGNYKLAVTRLEALQEAEKIRSKDVKAKQLAIEMAKYQVIEKDNQIILLNKQNQILQLESELAHETAIFNRWLIALLISTVSMLVLWVYSVKRAQQKLKYLAEYDSLTEISNRAFFTKSAEGILSYFANSKRTVCLILFDLDHFKKVNDTFGHMVGDEVLKLSAKACLGSVRKIDIFGRIGGEEFAILLPGCELAHALRIAEECRSKISEIDPAVLEQKFQITASFGVAESQACGYSLKDLLSSADEAMYIAKRRGRNQVVAHSGE